MTLTEFLLARIAEDEAVARMLSAHPETDMRRVRAVLSRVLAECEAKRRIVEMHHGVHFSPSENSWEDYTYCDVERGAFPEDWPCPTLRLLAMPYADHPDYDESWRP